MEARPEVGAATTRAGRVFDTLYREGEWVAAGSPVVRMLPPQNVKVRFFVPETIVGSARDRPRGGDPVRRLRRRHPGDAHATCRHEAEFTPPVIYSNETRSKLVFMVEARPVAPRTPRSCIRASR